MGSGDFFESQDERSLAKTEIVAKYFRAWTRVVMGPARARDLNIAFMDLFSGPGRFADGRYSTPLRILEEAVNDVELCERLELRFNDKDPQSIETLAEEITLFPGIENLHCAPMATSIEVSRDLVPTIERAGQIPTLFCVDPWGYKGLSLDLLSSAIRGWGCDLIFFFNYNRISPAVPNSKVDELIDDLFGHERARALRTKLVGVTGYDREMLILNEMVEAIWSIGGRFILPFKFRARAGDRTSHYLIFVTKEFRGFHIMKEIMAGVGSPAVDDSLRFEFHNAPSIQLSLLVEFYAGQRLDKLENWLLQHFTGRSVKVKRVYGEHEIHRLGTAYLKSDYKQAIRQLELRGAVTLDKPPEQRIRKGEVTVGDDRTVYFPAD